MVLIGQIKWSYIMDTVTGKIIINNRYSNIVISIRAMKWWKRVFTHLIDLSLVNANILYNESSSKPMNHMDFRLSVATSLSSVATSLSSVATSLSSVATSLPSSNNPQRLTSQCFPEVIPKKSQYGGLNQCVVCRSKGKRSQTRYQCKTCLVALHIDGCFELYHTKEDYSK